MTPPGRLSLTDQAGIRSDSAVWAAPGLSIVFDIRGHLC